MRKPTLRGRHWHLPDGWPVLLTLIALCLYLTAANSRFLTTSNVSNILEQVSMIGIIAMGMTMLLVSANFDLSVGGLVGVVSVVIAKASNALGVVPAVIIGLILATALGVFNGLLVTRLRINSLIATLGTGLAFLGAAYLISSNVPVQLSSTQLTTLANDKVLGLSVPVYVFAAVIAVSAWLLHITVAGRQLYAVGANREAARYAGVRVELIRFLPFVITGFLCGVSSIILVGLLSSGVPDAAENWPIQIIAAVVVGGVSVAGGQGTIFMAVVGIVLIGVVNNGLNLLNLQAGWQDVTTGAILVLAVATDAVLRSRARRRPAAGSTATFGIQTSPTPDATVTSPRTAATSPPPLSMRGSRPHRGENMKEEEI